MKKFVGAVLVLLAACGGPPVDKTGRVPGIMSLTPDVAAGAGVYTSTCSGCHGPEGKGKTGPAIGTRVTGLETAEVATIAINGSGLMGAAGVALTDQQVADMAAWVKANIR